MSWQAVGRIICWVCAVSWFLVGILYMWAGTVAPLEFAPAATFVPESLDEFFLRAQQGTNLYVITFTFFTIADVSLLFLASVLRRIVGDSDFRGQVVYIAVSLAMILGVVVDLLLLSNWLIIGSHGAVISPSAKAALGVSTLLIQSIGVWMSAASFLIGGVGLFIAYSALRNRQAWKGWATMTLILGALAWLEVFAIIFDVATKGSGIFTATAFLLLTNVAAPVWAIWLQRKLGRIEAAE